MVSRIIQGIRRRWIEVVLVLLMDVVYAFSFFQRVAVPGTIFDQFQSEFALSSGGVALLGGIYLYVYGGLQLPVGLAIDRFGATRVIVLGGALLTLGSIAFPLSQSVIILYATRALVGLGSSLMYLAVVKEIDNRFHDRHFSMVLGASSLIGSLGGLMGTFPFERSVNAIGWRGSLLWVGAACGVAVFGVACFARKAPKGAWARSNSDPFVALRRVFANRQSYPVFGASSIIFGTYFVVQAVIGKKLLQDCYGLSSSTAASYTFLMMLVTMGMAGISGFLPALIGYRRKPILIAVSCGEALATAGIIACLSFRQDPRWVLACYLLLGVSVGNNVMFSCSIKELNWADAAATSVGVLNSVCYLSVAVLVTLSGWILDLFLTWVTVTSTTIRYPVEAYRMVFMVLFELSVCAIVLASLIRETRGKNMWTDSDCESSCGADAAQMI
ncbi:MAG: MFS transporter [Armatimonadota bacterium]